MASFVYTPAKKKFFDAGINLFADVIRVVLIDAADYVPNAAHEFLIDVPVAARVGAPQALTNKTTTDGVFDADDVVIPSVVGDQTEAILLFKDTGAESSSPLIAYFDNASLLVSPNGGNITVSWDNGINKILRLGA